MDNTKKLTCIALKDHLGQAKYCYTIAILRLKDFENGQDISDTSYIRRLCFVNIQEIKEKLNKK